MTRADAAAGVRMSSGRLQNLLEMVDRIADGPPGVFVEAPWTEGSLEQRIGKMSVDLMSRLMDLAEAEKKEVGNGGL